MPTIAETSGVKRLLSNLLFAEEAEAKPIKRQRVRFDDNVEVRDGSSAHQSSGCKHGEHQDGDFFDLPVGEDGGWHYTNISAAKKGDGATDDAKPSPITRRSGSLFEFAGSDLSLSEELFMMSNIINEGKGEEEEDEEEPLLRVNSSGSLGNNLKISLKACAADVDDGACTANAMPTPLITPPSSPRRIRTLSFDGAFSEETTICEWPCNLAVDNAITAALESAPLTLSLGSSCNER